MIAVIVQARSGSTRLPGKILKKIMGKTLLVLFLERIKKMKKIDKIIVATTTLTEDDKIVSIVKEFDSTIGVFRGDSEDVLDRYYKCAKKFGVDTIVRITSDCPLTDPNISDEVVEKFIETKTDYCCNNMPKTYPHGLDTEVFSFRALEIAWKEANEKREREHVTPYIREHPNIFRTTCIKCNRNLSHMRWTVDYKEDFEFVKKIFSKLYKENSSSSFSMVDVLSLLEKEPEIFDINRKYGEYHNLIIYSPAYNVEKSLPELLERLLKIQKKLLETNTVISRYIIVEDGSSDKTSKILRSYGAKIPFLKVIYKQKNEGVVSALLGGMAAALECAEEKNLSGENTIMIRMDTDLEHQPEDLPKLLAPLLSKESNLSVGYIRFDYRHGIFVKLFNDFIGPSESRRFLGLEIPQFCPGFNAIRLDLFKRLLPQLLDLTDDFRKVSGKQMVSLDFGILFLVRRLGENIYPFRLRSIEDKWVKHSNFSKIGKYLDYHSITSKFLSHYDQP